MTKTITLPRSVLEQVLEALKIGHESAHDCAETFHIEMAGYKQQRHEALDAEVKQISDAIGVLRAALDQPQDHPEQRLDMVPAGWKLVPVEPTEEMLRSSCGCESPAMFRESLRRETDGRLTAEMVEKIIRRHLASYRAMLAAAPQPPALEQPQGEQEPVAWAEEIIEYLHAHYDTEMIKELDSGDALIRLDDAIAAVEEVAQRHARPQPKREPLTDDERQDVYAKAIKAINNDPHLPWRDAIVFETERAHGIGGEA